jgi:hypothetical protein
MNSAVRSVENTLATDPVQHRIVSYLADFFGSRQRLFLRFCKSLPSERIQRSAP